MTLTETVGRLNPWTEIAVELLKVGVANGAPFSAIAAEIGNGVTRNACIGKARRIGLSQSSKSKNAIRYGMDERTRRKAVLDAQKKSEAFRREARAVVPRPYRVTPPRPVAPPEVFASGGITLLELRRNSCRWPSGDPHTPEFRFCGAKTDGQRVHCVSHFKLAYVPGSSRAGSRVPAASHSVEQPAGARS